MEVEAEGFRRASRRAGSVAVKVAQNVTHKRFSTKLWLRLELLSTPPFYNRIHGREGRIGRGSRNRIDERVSILDSRSLSVRVRHAIVHSRQLLFLSKA